MRQRRNRQIKLAARPVGNPRREDFAFETVEVVPEDWLIAGGNA